MKPLSVIKWTLFLLILIAVAIGVGGVWFWQNSDRLTRSILTERFELLAPDLTLQFGQVTLLPGKSVHLKQVEIRDRKTNQSLLRAAEVIALIDETELFERQRVRITSIVARRIDALLIRRDDGRWNWQDYRFVRQADARLLLPQISTEDIRAQVILEHGKGLPSANLLVTSPSFQAVPSTSQAYDFSGDIVLPHAGPLALTGDWNLKTHEWQLGGRMRDIHVGQKLASLAHSASPQLSSHMAQLDSVLERYVPGEAVSPAAVSNAPTAAMIIGHSGFAPRFLGMLNVDFHIAGSETLKAPDLRLKVDIRDGQLSSSAIEDKLTDVQASIFRDNNNLVVRVTQALDGDAKISGSLQMSSEPDAAPPEIALHVERFVVDKRLQPFFPVKARPFFDNFLPKGLVTGDVVLRPSPSGKWLPVNLNATLDHGAAEYHKFRYPIREITGSVTQRTFDGVDFVEDNVIFDLKAQGLAGNRIVTASGIIRRPGPESEMLFDLQANGLPIDSQFRDSLDQAGRRVIDSLGITGVASATARCYREPGMNRPMHMLLNAEVSKASMRFSGFQYDIQNLSGNIRFDTRDKSWEFTSLRGQHGEGLLTAHGAYHGDPLPGVLNIELTAKNCLLDADLYNALRGSSRGLWSMLQPKGRVDLTTNIHWTAQPGQQAVVRLPAVHIYEGELYPEAFPYRMKVDSLKLSYDPNDPRFAGVQHCEIHEFHGRHNSSPISATGWAEISPNQLWQLHLNDLTATDLVPDDDLRAAMPDSWHETLSRLSRQGKVAIESSQLDFRGSTNADVQTTAAWEMNLRLNKCGVAAGLQLENVSGIVIARGNWDGMHLTNVGDIRLDTVDVLGKSLTRVFGPYMINDDELLLGSRDIFTSNPSTVPAASQLQAQGYGGSLMLNAVVGLNATNRYRLFSTINNALVEAYAAKHIPDQRNLKGVVNAWLYLTGEGEDPENVEGKGQIRISPAALYELPLMVKLFSALGQLNFAVPNRTAFDYALVSFDVRERAFWFDPIDLVGDSMALRGRGSIGFGGDVWLDFYSRPAQSRGPSIPLIKDVLFNSTTRWVGVQVRGTVDRPQTEVRSRIEIDESMKQFLSAFQPSPNGTIPALRIPSIFASPRGPQAFRGP